MRGKAKVQRVWHRDGLKRKTENGKRKIVFHFPLSTFRFPLPMMKSEVALVGTRCNGCDFLPRVNLDTREQSLDHDLHTAHVRTGLPFGAKRPVLVAEPSRTEDGASAVVEREVLGAHVIAIQQKIHQTAFDAGIGIL